MEPTANVADSNSTSQHTQGVDVMYYKTSAQQVPPPEWPTCGSLVEAPAAADDAIDAALSGGRERPTTAS
jgi:hypothetical protein